MKNKWIQHVWIFLLVVLFLFNCYSNKNRTEERMKERITQFILLMAKDQIDEAEKLLSSKLVDSGNMELFLNNFDDWQMKDTNVVINIDEIYFPPKKPKIRAMISMTVYSKKNDFTKIVSMPISYEKGDWYIGA